MQREAIHDAWVPAEGAWSLWAKPVLFAQMKMISDPWLSIPVHWTPSATGKVVLIVDLPGELAVHVGLALAGRGYRPVPLFNACTGASELIDQLPIARALQVGAAYLAALALPASAPPAFLLDSRRRNLSVAHRGMLDNRWRVFPEDFPSWEALQQRGVSRVLLIQSGRSQPKPDLARVLFNWEGAQVALHAKDIDTADPPHPLRIPWHLRLWSRLYSWVALEQSRPDGFGYIVTSSG